MNVIYSSDHFWILAYPAQHSFELFDKVCLRTLFLDGPLASHFCHAMADIPEIIKDNNMVMVLFKYMWFRACRVCGPSPS